MTVLSSLDLLLIVSTIVIAVSGIYTVVILHRVAHMMYVADRFAQTIEKFQDIFAIVDNIPTNIIRKMSHSFSKISKK